MMEAEDFSEMLISFYKTCMTSYPRDHNLHGIVKPQAAGSSKMLFPNYLYTNQQTFIAMRTSDLTD
jgi:hypothetical protein